MLRLGIATNANHGACERVFTLLPTVSAVLLSRLQDYFKMPFLADVT